VVLDLGEEEGEFLGELDGLELVLGVALTRTEFAVDTGDKGGEWGEWGEWGEELASELVRLFGSAKESAIVVVLGEFERGEELREWSDEGESKDCWSIAAFTWAPNFEVALARIRTRPSACAGDGLREGLGRGVPGVKLGELENLGVIEPDTTVGREGYDEVEPGVSLATGTGTTMLAGGAIEGKVGVPWSFGDLRELAGVISGVISGVVCVAKCDTFALERGGERRKLGTNEASCGLHGSGPVNGAGEVTANGEIVRGAESDDSSVVE
jgi:hypothetical protein